MTRGKRSAPANDPNYRWFNGRWWYWQKGGYLMWNGNAVGTARGADIKATYQRAFSYVE